MSNFCPSCGTKVDEGNKFCLKCGAELEIGDASNPENTPSSPVQQAPPTQQKIK